MLANPLKGYVVFGAEPELDSVDGRRALSALRAADFVVAVANFASAAKDYAHVLLPLAPFTETDGSFVNAEGRLQSFEPAVPPAGESRPGWKILRVLGNQFGLGGFGFTTSAEVRAELNIQTATPSARLRTRRFHPVAAVTGLQRISDTPLYKVDALVRRAPALQRTRDSLGPIVRMNPAEAQRHNIGSATKVRVIAGGESITLDFHADPRVPDGSVYIPAGYSEVLAIGDAVTVHVEAAR
jgi:NADH-quinone oxidoreductase subunit G